MLALTYARKYNSLLSFTIFFTEMIVVKYLQHTKTLNLRMFQVHMMIYVYYSYLHGAWHKNSIKIKLLADD